MDNRFNFDNNDDCRITGDFGTCEPQNNQPNEGKSFEAIHMDFTYVPESVLKAGKITKASILELIAGWICVLVSSVMVLLIDDPNSFQEIGSIFGSVQDIDTGNLIIALPIVSVIALVMSVLAFLSNRKAVTLLGKSTGKTKTIKVLSIISFVYSVLYFMGFFYLLTQK